MLSQNQNQKLSDEAKNPAIETEGDEQVDVLSYEEKIAAGKAGRHHAYRLLPLNKNEKYAQCLRSESQHDKDYAKEFKRGYEAIDPHKDTTISFFAKDVGQRLADSDKSEKSKKHFADAYNRVPNDQKELFLKTAKKYAKDDELVDSIVSESREIEEERKEEKTSSVTKKNTIKEMAFNAGRTFALLFHPFGSGRKNPKNIKGSEYAKEYKRGYDSVDQTSDENVRQFGKNEGKWLQRSSGSGKPNTKRFREAYKRVPQDKKEMFVEAANEIVKDQPLLETIIRGKEIKDVIEPRRLIRKRDDEDLRQAERTGEQKEEKPHKQQKIKHSSSSATLDALLNSPATFFSSSGSSNSSSSSSSSLSSSLPNVSPPKVEKPSS